MTSFSQEQVAQAYASAPEAVRAFIDSGELIEAAMAIEAAHALSSAAGDAFATAARDMLLGLQGEQGVAEVLASAGVPAAQAASIAKELGGKLPRSTASAGPTKTPPVQPAPVQKETVAAPVAPVASPKPPAPASYSSDPYREPVE